MQMFSSKKRKNVIPDALFESVLHVSVQIVLIGIAAVIFAQLGVHSTNVTTFQRFTERLCLINESSYRAPLICTKSAAAIMKKSLFIHLLLYVCLGLSI